MLENTWEKCDVEHKGQIAQSQAVELHSNLLQIYYSQSGAGAAQTKTKGQQAAAALTAGTANAKFVVLESVSQLKRFGIIRSAAAIVDRSID